MTLDTDWSDPIKPIFGAGMDRRKRAAETGR
jgi:hypothetical protein